jgi:hypothetical protein
MRSRDCSGQEPSSLKLATFGLAGRGDTAQSYHSLRGCESGLGDNSPGDTRCQTSQPKASVFYFRLYYLNKFVDNRECTIECLRMEARCSEFLSPSPLPAAPTKRLWRRQLNYPSLFGSLLQNLFDVYRCPFPAAS